MSDQPTWPEAISDVCGCLLQIVVILCVLKLAKAFWEYL